MNKIYTLNLHLVVSVFALTTIILLLWKAIPNTICLHFNYEGLCDNILPKIFIFLLPILTILLLIMLKYISLNPDQINLGKEASPENIAKIINILSVLIVLVFSIITFLFLISNNIISMKSSIIYFYMFYLLFPVLLVKSKFI